MKTAPSIVLAVSAILVPLAPAQETRPADDGLGLVLDRALQRATAGGFWGAVLVARGPDVVLAKGYGYADYARRPNDADTLFEIASTSKQFTAAAVLRLEMDGGLALEDTLDQLLDDVPEDKRAITVRHLLTHTSGISPRLGLPYASTATRDELVRMVLEHPLETPAGERFAYCNVAYALLAAIVEIVAGRPFEDYCRVALFEPAGLESTGFVQDARLDASRASVRLSEDRPRSTAVDWYWGWGYRGMGGVVSTANDLLRWHRALLTDRVLDERARERLYAPELEGYACGWRVAPTGRGTRVVSHSGGVEGYACQYLRYLEEDVCIVLLGKDGGDVHRAQTAIEEQLFPRPRVTLALDVEGFELDEHRAVRVDDGARWSVRTTDGGIALTLAHPTGHALARVDLPEPAARQLAAELAVMLADRRASGADPGEAAAVEAGVYLANYGDGERKLTLVDVTPVLMPRYVGMRDGERYVDERITLVVRDGRFWPVMAKMGDGACSELLRALSAALERGR